MIPCLSVESRDGWLLAADVGVAVGWNPQRLRHHGPPGRQKDPGYPTWYYWAPAVYPNDELVRGWIVKQREERRLRDGLLLTPLPSQWGISESVTDAALGRSNIANARELFREKLAAGEFVAPKKAGTPPLVFTYFIRSLHGGAIKIGKAKSVAHRLSSLNTARPEKDLRVMRSVVGCGEYAEQVLHRRFAHLHISGEWFHDGDDLLGFVYQLPVGSNA